MESKHNNSNAPFWKGVCVGASVMLLLAVAFYFVERFYLHNPILITQNVHPKDPNAIDTVIQIVEKKHYYYPKQEEKSPTTDTDSTATDSTLVVEVREEDLQEDDFSFNYNPTTDDDGEIYRNQVLAIRKIAVVQRGEEVDSTYTPHHFDVEQLSEAIVNKRSYMRNGYDLKVKGLDIQNIQIILWGGNYFLEKEGHYYALPENQKFDRLQEWHPTQE